MRKRDRKLIAIAFDAAGHAKSKNSRLYPFLGEASREQGYSSITLDLLHSEFKEKEFRTPKEVNDVLPRLKSKLESLLLAQKFVLKNLEFLEVEYKWDKYYPDWQCACKVVVVTDSGEKTEEEEDAGPGYFM
ncbi:MAG: hypothetical protein AB2810_19445 [Candidatus Thiodiazotropha endolucinida]